MIIHARNKSINSTITLAISVYLKQSGGQNRVFFISLLKVIPIQCTSQLGSTLTQRGIQNLQQISSGCSELYLPSTDWGHVQIPEHFVVVMDQALNERK